MCVKMYVNMLDHVKQREMRAELVPYD